MTTAIPKKPTKKPLPRLPEAEQLPSKHWRGLCLELDPAGEGLGDQL